MPTIRPTALARPLRVASMRSGGAARPTGWATSPGAGSIRRLSNPPAASSTSGSGSGSGSNSSSCFPRSRLRWLPLAAVPAAGLLLIPTLSAEEPPVSAYPTLPAPSSLTSCSTTSLLRTYLVYTLICVPGMVDYSPAILSFLSRSPLRAPTEWLIRQTFFPQFVPGETVAECLPSMEEMKLRGVGSILNYSAEVDEDGASDLGPEGREERDRLLIEARTQEVLLALEKSGEFEKKLPVGQRGATSFALKVTGLCDPSILSRASYTLLRLRPLTRSAAPSSPHSAPSVPYPGTPQSEDGQVVARDVATLGPGRELLALKGIVPDMGVLETDEGLKEGDIEKLRELWVRLRMLSEKAKQNSVALLLDAEYTWYQPALDAYTLLLSEEFNRPPKSKSEPWNGPVIFGTYQSYLTRQPSHLIAALQHAETHGYALGLKLVRGAYHEKERKKWKTEGRPGADPIWTNKALTDVAYNTSVQAIIAALAVQLNGPHPERALSVTFGTHNSDSAELVCEGLQGAGLAMEVEGGRLQLRADALGKVGVAQLYGMKDDLTDRMAARFVNDGKPVALKYIAYGKLAEVMPFLSRRALENKSVMSGDDGAAAERKRVGAELKRRMFGGA